MTVAVQTPISSYTGNGVTTAFSFGYYVAAAGDLVVMVDGVVKALTTDYTLTGIGSGSGGTCTFVTAPASGADVVLYRDTDLLRETDYQDNGDLLAAILNGDFDRIWLALQETITGAKLSPRAIRAPVGETLNELSDAAARAGKLLSFNATTGQPEAVAPTSGTATDLAIQLASTASGDGASLIGVQDSGGYFASANAEEIFAELGNPAGQFARGVNVLRYIPPAEWPSIFDGTSTYDCSAAFQAWIDGNDDLYMPAGATFKFQSGLYWKCGIRLAGGSKRTCILDFSAVSGPCFTAQLNRHGASFRVQGLRDSEVFGFKVIGNVSDATNHIFSSDYGWHRNNVHDVWFYSCGGDAIHLNCDNSYGGFYNTFKNNVFGDPSDFSTGSDTTLIKGNGIWATGSCNENTVANNVFWRVKGHSIHLVGTASWTIQRWTIEKNGVEWSGYFFPSDNRYGVFIEGNSQRMTVRENYFEGNGSGNTSPSGGGIWCNNSALDISIKDNLFANQTFDINIQSAFNVDIDGNSFIAGVGLFNIRVFSVATNSGKIGQVRIGHNPDFNNTLSKFLSVAAPSQAQVYGDVVMARQRGNNVLWGKFTPRIYGGTTEISCSNAIGVYERRDDMLVVDVSLTVSNLNGATGSVTVVGSDGNAGKIPGLSGAVGYTSRNDSTLPVNPAPCQISNVTLGAGFTHAVAFINQTGVDAILLRKNGSGQPDTAVDASSLTVGSVIRFKLAYYI